MNKGTITIEIPILDDVDQMEVVNTFNKKQLWYVCAIAKAFEKSQQDLQKKDDIINELKDYINRFLYMLNGILDRDIYEQCQLDDFTQIMDKIKELENGQSND